MKLQDFFLFFFIFFYPIYKDTGPKAEHPIIRAPAEHPIYKDTRPIV